MSRYRRRKLVNRLMEGLATVAALLALAVLAIVVVSVARRGAPALSWDFFSKGQALFGQPGGGIANALVGTVLLVGALTFVPALALGPVVEHFQMLEVQP